VYLEENGTRVDFPKCNEVKDFYSKSSPENTYLIVEDSFGNVVQKVKFISEKDPTALPWEENKIDVVLECTGRFVKDGAAKKHLEAGAQKVVVSAPVKGEGNVPTYLKGVNHDQINEDVISNASCTTNCISPVMSVLHSKFKVLKSGMTTIHAYTSTQSLVDNPAPGGSSDVRRGRAAAFNMIPTTTGAAIATTKVIPELEGKFDGLSIRVPINTGSLSDITALVEKDTTVEEINNTFIEFSKNPFFENVLAVSHEPIVSSDIVKNSHSAIVDLSMTKVIDGNFVKILVWYDNEWGYSNRLVDMIAHISE
jgi:glyceraldehyde 3-phosphate dehydrogenase